MKKKHKEQRRKIIELQELHKEVDIEKYQLLFTVNRCNKFLKIFKNSKRVKSMIDFIEKKHYYANE